MAQQPTQRQMTAEKKDKTIVLRVDELTKGDLEILAQLSRRTVSDYLRLLIEYASEKKIKF